MADHKISADGLSIECHASPHSDCRRRPDCDADRWEWDQCFGHPDNPHPVTDGHECWMKTNWLDPQCLDDTYFGPGAPVTIYPGMEVVLEFQGEDEGVTWKYAHQVRNEI